MALLFIDGFDHYDPQALDAQGQPLLARGKATYLSPQAVRIQGRRPSSYALRLPAGPGGGYVKTLESPRTSLIVGAAVRVAPFEAGLFGPVLLGVRDSGAQVSYFVELSSDGRLNLFCNTGYCDQLLATSSVSAPVRGWHYVELKVVQGTNDGVLSVRLNGILAIHLTAQDTVRDGGQLLTAFLGALPGRDCPVTIDVDDFYVADASGTINNTFLGDVRVDALKAQANGSLNEWTADPAGADAWQVVGDDDDATAISADSAGLKQTFDVESLPAMATPAVHGVQLTMLARKSDAGTGSIKGLVKSGAQNATSPDIALQEDLAWHTALFESNPDGNVQWTEGAVNSAEFGVESA